MRAMRSDDFAWWIFFDDGLGILKERERLDRPVITKEQMDEFIALIEEVIKR